MQVKDISRETAIFLLQRRRKVLYERQKDIKLIPPKRTIRKQIYRNMQTEEPTKNRRVADEIEYVYNELKTIRNKRFIINDAELD
jgi:hypothetical protein